MSPIPVLSSTGFTGSFFFVFPAEAGNQENQTSPITARKKGHIFSGGSGNQGILMTLLPYIVGRDRQIELKQIQESVAISHAVNSYIKCFTGELFPLSADARLQPALRRLSGWSTSCGGLT